MQAPTKTEHLQADEGGIARASALLSQGGLVAIPTETVYGLAADARRPEAVAGIYAAKGRPSYNPLITHIFDLAAARRYALISPEAEALAAAFWPGPLTLVLPLRHDAGLAPAVTAGLGTVALRAPAHPTARALLRAFGGPLAAPSANPSGRISPTEAAHVLDAETGLAGRIAAVLDAGPCPVGLESTILGWLDGAPSILRPGGVTAAQIEAVLGRPVASATHAPSPQAPLAPGQLSSHYAPSVALRLDASEAEAGETLIGFGSGPAALNLSPSGDLAEAAANLFALLRRADALGRPIAVAPIPREGLGLAINDRLTRAAAPR